MDHARVRWPRLSSFVVSVSIVCVGLLALAALLPTQGVAEFFHHPLRDAGSATNIDGANMLRIMLVVTACFLFAWSLKVTQPNVPGIAIFPAQHRSSRHELGFLIIVLLLGALLRMQRLGESLWYDEIAAWVSYGRYGPGPIVGNFADPSNHVLHTLLTWLSVTLTDRVLSSEMSLRLPAFVASLLSIVAIYALARRTLGIRCAVVASTLLALWPVSVLEGAEARGYSMMILFSTLASLQLIVAMEKPKPLAWLLYACFIALGTWAHMVTAFVAIGHSVWLMRRLFDASTRLAAQAGLCTLILAMTITVTLYAPILPEIAQRRAIISATAGTQPGPFGTEGVHALWQLGGSWLWYAALPSLALLALGISVVARRREVAARTVFIITFAGLPMAYGLVIVLGTWVYARFLLFALPGAAIMCAVGWNRLRQRVPWAAVALSALVIIACAVDLVTRPPKQPLREASDYVYDHGGKGANVLVISIAHPVFDAYGEGLHITTSFKLGANLESDLARSDANWVVMLYPNHVSADVFAMLQRHGFTPRKRFAGWADWGEGDIVVFERATVP